MTESKSKYSCEKHGDIDAQVFTIGYYDQVRNFIMKTFCGVCHYDMLAQHCLVASPVHVEAPKVEEPRIVTRGIQ